MASNYPNDPVLSVDWRCTTWLRYSWKSHLKLKLRTKNNTAHLASLSNCPAQLQRQLLNLGIFTGEMWALSRHSLGQRGKILEVTYFKRKEACKVLNKPFLTFFWSRYLALQKPLGLFSTLLQTLSVWSQLSVSSQWDCASTHDRCYAHTYCRGNNANTCYCKCNCLFIAQAHPYFFEIKITAPHTVPYTQFLGWQIQQLFTL